MSNTKVVRRDSPAPQSAETSDRAATDALTARETEVLSLLGIGFSNQQIADELVIGVRTAETHVERILRKLNLGRRSEAMIWVRERGLRTARGSTPELATNIPLQLASFVGREGERSELHRLLNSGRFVTLTGTGGVGKTRLALKVATERLDRYADGVWVVDLSPVAQPDLVPHAVARVMGVRQAAELTVIEALAGSLRSCELLLVLDNCEHLIQACAELANALMGACPRLRILSTSRESLGVAGETIWRVPPLQVPEPNRMPSVDSLTGYESVRLFVDRALAVQPGFAVTEQNARAVAQICFRLDGIPLAIELAAARMKLLTAQDIAQRLDDCFGLLTFGSRTALPRQQTLRALVDWSFDLLSDNEKVFFRRMAAFAGGWTLEAAEVVCVMEPIEAWQVLDLLGALVEKSLVHTHEQPSGRIRFHLLGQYARNRLQVTGEAEVLGARHIHFFQGLAERAELALEGHEQQAWLDDLEQELENIRAALMCCHEYGEVESGLRIAAGLWRFWSIRGYLAEGRDHLEHSWLETVLPCPASCALGLIPAQAT